MKIFSLIGLAVCFQAYGADLTATVDGTNRRVTLHENGTWETAQEKTSPLTKYPNNASTAVTVFDTTILNKEVNYRQAVTLEIRYKNNTKKRVTGLLASLTVKNGFGTILYSTTLEEDIAIEADTTTDGGTYWHWGDNKFINGEPYDKMWQAVENNTAKVDLKVIKVVFEDGEILKDNPVKQTKNKK